MVSSPLAFSLPDVEVDQSSTGDLSSDFMPEYPNEEERDKGNFNFNQSKFMLLWTSLRPRPTLQHLMYVSHHQHTQEGLVHSS